MSPCEPPRRRMDQGQADGASICEVVPAAIAGERIDRVVSMLTGISRSDASGLVQRGAVKVNGTVVTTRARRLCEGDLVAASWSEPTEQRLAPDPSIALDIVHVDEQVIVVDKPPGLVVHPGAGHEDGTLVNGLLARFPDLDSVDWPDPTRPGIVHRIDRETSGLLMIARTRRCSDELIAQLHDRSVERRYTALVWGTFEAPYGEIDAPIARSRRDPTKMTVAADGKEARTGYTVERSFSDPVAVSLLSCRLFSGRTHQIRVHMQSIGQPVVGDARYGGFRQSLRTERFFLHAASLGFTHPSTGERLRFESALPSDLAGLLADLS